MALTLGELAERIGATLSSGDGGKTIDGVSSLGEAGPRQLAPFTDERYLPQLQKTQAGAVVTKNGIAPAGLPAATVLLWSADPEMAYVKALEILYPQHAETPGIDPRAVIESGVELGENVYVGPHAVIRKGSRIGAGSWIMPNVVIGRDCRVGAGCRLFSSVVLYDGVTLGARVTIHSGSVIGADGFGYKFRGGRHVKVPQIGGVEIGDDVEIGANTCIDRGALHPTRIGSGTKIDNLVQIGHGAIIGNHCILCGQAAVAGSSGMGDYAVLGGNAGVGDHVFMAKGSKAGAKSGVARDTRPGEEVFGLYADERTAAFKQLAAVRCLPDFLERLRTLEREIKALKAQKQS